MLLVLDPRDGHEVFALALEDTTFGGTFGASTVRELRFDPDGSLVVVAHDEDEAEQARCEGTDEEDCGVSVEVEGRWVWDPRRRVMEPVE